MDESRLLVLIGKFTEEYATGRVSDDGKPLGRTLDATVRSIAAKVALEGRPPNATISG